MKQQTIKEVLSEDGDVQEADYRLYLVREGETVFYVGQAKNTYNRLLAHLGMDGRSAPSAIGQLILENVPVSDAWLFEEYTLEEGEAFVTAYRATLPQQMQAFYRENGSGYDVDLAEDAMIKLYRPCLNTALNPDPTPLPEQYQRWPD